MYMTTIIKTPTTGGGTCWFAEHPELPGCQAHGGTPAEAQHNLSEARAMWLAHSAQVGLPLPESRNPLTVVTWDWALCS